MNNNAFTLIELLVVISIVSLLTSVVLASLQSARDSATTAAIKSEGRELLKLAQMHYFAQGGFNSFVNPGWITSATDCNNRILSSAQNEANAETLCSSMIEKISPATQSSTDYYMFIGANEASMVSGNDCTDQTCFAINIKVGGPPATALSGSQSWWCISSEGSIANDHTFSHTLKGCERNP